MRRYRCAPRVAGLAVAAVLALGLAACGGSGGGAKVASLNGSGSSGEPSGGDRAAGGARDPQDAAIEFARCMREHGVDMPDPQVDSGGKLQLRVGGENIDRDKLQSAQKACGHLLESLRGGRMGSDPEMREAMVRFAGCMREHGIDMPDPGPDGGLLYRKGAGGVGTAKFEEAQRACDHLLRKARPDGAAP